MGHTGPVPRPDPEDLAPNAARFAGFADFYDAVRPRPPDDLGALLSTYCGVAAPDVVDLGSGSGLSSRWASGWAGSVVGVEPGVEMRAVAERSATGPVRFVGGFAHATGLSPDSADVVTAVQALHWMEPVATLAEVARLLRPGGVFAAVDCDWPPTVGAADLERAWSEGRRRLAVLEARLAGGASGADLRSPVGADRSDVETVTDSDPQHGRPLARGVTSWSKSTHLHRMIASGHFSWCHELALHRTEPGDADRFVGLYRSQGDYQTLRDEGLDEEQLGVTALGDAARSALGRGPVPFLFTYRVRVGVVPG